MIERYTVQKVEQEHKDYDAEMIRAGHVKFAVVEDGADTVITVQVEQLDGEVYLGAGEYETRRCVYSVVENNDVLYYSEFTVEDFVKNYLSQCHAVTQHWTVGA